VLFPTRRSFEQSPSVRSTPSLSQTHAFSGSHRRHSSHLSSPATNTLQNQRVAAIIQGTGHSTTSTAFTNRFTPAAQNNNFYASSAPSSSVALHSAPQQRPRPQVPLFSQSTGNIPQQQQNFQNNNNMNQGMIPRAAPVIPPRTRSHNPPDMSLFDDFPPFEVEENMHASFASAYSPAVPTIYDTSMTRSDSSSTNIGTISPHELMIRDPTFSAPNSTAFTNLTSPSMYNESPDFDGYEVSPMFQNTDLDASITDPWFSLFPTANQANAPTNHSTADQSPLEAEEELEVAEYRRKHQRRASGTSPGSNKASSVSGVAARKRNQPLPPIVVEDENDTIAIKRARNTLAARKSRQKKMERFDELEAEIAQLKADRDHWKTIALARSTAQQ
jgi:general control protein GCN4